MRGFEQAAGRGIDALMTERQKSLYAENLDIFHPVNDWIQLAVTEYPMKPETRESQ